MSRGCLPRLLIIVPSVAHFATVESNNEAGLEKVTFTLDGKEITAKIGMSILEAALADNVYIPHLCYHPELESRGVCRMCVVEIDGKLVSSCRIEAQNGMVVKAKSPLVEAALRPTVEMLMADHHVTCKGCTASGKCQLQKVMAYMKIDRKRVNRLHFPDEQPLVENPAFIYDPNKCILCGVCIQTCEKLNGTSVLEFVGRGYETKIRWFGEEERCHNCRKCAERCPVQVITFKEIPELRDP